MERSESGLPNIVITGSWRSGTSFLYLAFPHAFHDAIINGRESSALSERLEDLLPAGYKWRITKSPNDIYHARKIIDQLNPYIIYMLRDPRDCIVEWRKEKENYYMSFNEWLRNCMFMESVRYLGYPNNKLVLCPFEDMILKPIEFQACLADQIKGLVVRRNLDECHEKMMDNGSRIYRQLSHSDSPAVRKLDKSVIGNWKSNKERIKEQLEKFPEMQAILEIYGYEVDDKWQKELYG